MGHAAAGYHPRAPEQGVLHTVVCTHLEAFVREAADRTDGAGLPRFVEDEFREFLTCGVLAHGFARLRCQRCGLDRFLPLDGVFTGSTREGDEDKPVHAAIAALAPSRASGMLHLVRTMEANRVKRPGPLRRLWHGWKRIGRKIGDFQARVLLTLQRHRAVHLHAVLRTRP